MLKADRSTISSSSSLYLPSSLHKSEEDWLKKKNHIHPLHSNITYSYYTCEYLQNNRLTKATHYLVTEVHTAFFWLCTFHKQRLTCSYR